MKMVKQTTLLKVLSYQEIIKIFVADSHIEHYIWMPQITDHLHFF